MPVKVMTLLVRYGRDNAPQKKTHPGTNYYQFICTWGRHHGIVPIIEHISLPQSRLAYNVPYLMNLNVHIVQTPDVYSRIEWFTLRTKTAYSFYVSLKLCILLSDIIVCDS